MAAGVDLPAFRAIIRDVRRFTSRGLSFIPVLEYLQMCGRAGRPSYDNEGQAILVASSLPEANQLTEQYIHGAPESIQSKLAVEPALRSAVLSLIATRSVRTKKQLFDFFNRTFWAHQYGDTTALESVVGKILTQLESWHFLSPVNQEEFASADMLEDARLAATSLGRRVAELYLDPLTAHHLISGLEQATKNSSDSVFPVLHLLTFTLEMRPYLRVRQKEYEMVEEKVEIASSQKLIADISPYDERYDDLLGAAKTAILLGEWIEEKKEDYLLEKFVVRPGELKAKITTCDWLIYSCMELCTLLDYKKMKTVLVKIRLRLKYGAKEELLPLLRLQQIGRIRARKLFANHIKSIADVRKTDISVLSKILGNAVAMTIKKQVGDSHEKTNEQNISRLDNFP